MKKCFGQIKTPLLQRLFQTEMVVF